MKEQTCYMCDKVATSQEHVPPICIFPEIKDLGIDYRKNLITVPSCDDHNQKKSNDDAYLMMVLTNNIKNNKVAMKQIKTKILRAWVKNHELEKSLLSDTRPVIVNGEQTLEARVNIARFNLSLDCIARGLYYNHYQKKWTEKLNIQSPALIFSENKNAQNNNNILNHMGMVTNRCMKNFPKFGENPDVFWYKILHPNPDELLINIMFFGGSQVVAHSISVMT